MTNNRTPTTHKNYRQLRAGAESPRLQALSDQRFKIKHPWLGYFLKLERTEWDGAKYHETWTKNYDEAPSFTLADLRAARDANNNGLMSILVAGYTGLSLEPVKA